MNPSASDGNSLCGKQSCMRPALVALTYDYRDRTVWLDDLGPDADPRAGLLCAACAERFTVPLGWQLHDRTSPLPQAAPAVTPLRSPAHPAVAARGVHEPDDVDSSLDLRVPDEEHPSGPLNLRERNEPKAVTLELERLARHLDTIPTPSSATPETGTRGGPRPGIPVRPARPSATPEPAVSGPDDDDDEDTFGDAVEDLTEELSVIGLGDAVWADEETQIEPPRWADPA